ncbi:uncharacterized protein LOC142245655 [Anomaloglossus baeobatrachus]|uniref:uncharacterized protein LOC142245655 n=1 Tax=Anomaloglossus baeobatrachus TaxID=238106 RepID=UPI003F5080D4
MILTKNGRRMFPEFSVSLSGLDPHGLYSLCVQAVPDGENRYKWRDRTWSMSGRAEPGPPTRLYLHPESPAPGHRWMERPICFHRIRLTNNTLSQGGQIVLQSMHRYYLRLYIIPTCNNGPRARPASSISFPETSFIAVTSYQNPRLSLLKIEENPFAKGIKYFKSQQEQTPRKRHQRPRTDGDVSPECKRHTESAAEVTVSQRVERAGDEIVERRLVSPERSGEERSRKREDRENRQTPGNEGLRSHRSPAQSRDAPHREATEDGEERGHRMDSLVQWDPITQRPLWASPPALSVTAYPAPACPAGHRFPHPPPSSLGPFPSSVSNFPPVAPYFMGSWASPPVRLSYPLSALHSPFLQPVCPPPWILPPHTTSRGL